MENISEKEPSSVKLSLTIKKGYIVTYKGPYKNHNLKGIMKLIKKAEKNNILLSRKLIQNLMTIEEYDFQEIKDQFNIIYTAQKGQFFRSIFATGEDIEDEEYTLDDFIEQISHYYVTYGLGEIDYDSFKINKKRKIQLNNVSKRKDKQEINNTFKVIETKDINGFIQDVKTIIESPIVFGVNEIEYIQEAQRLGFLGSILNSVKDFKVKENLFNIIDITGKEFIKKVDVLKTGTDILRYCYWASDLDFKYLEKGIRFNLKTSDKKIVMMTLNTLFNKNEINLYSDMKPYKSQWLSVSRNLFPGSKKFNRYSGAQRSFDYIRNGCNLETFNSITQKLIETDIHALILHLSKKPGELLRRLDMIIRKGNKEDAKVLCKVLKDIKINSKLIIQVRKWLEFRINNGFESRTFNIKGKAKTINKPIKQLKEKRTKKVIKVLRDKLIENLKGKELF